MSRLLLFISLFFSFQLVNSAILKVPSTYPTIQSALDSCAQGDTVLVSPGTYRESIRWPRTQGLKLIGEKGRDSTVVVNTGNDRVITIQYSFSPQIRLDTTTIISGFTISNRIFQGDTAIGGGIKIYENDVKLVNLIIKNNYLDYQVCWGAGILFRESNSIMIDCIVKKNTIDAELRAFGSGIHLYEGVLQMRDCKIDSNYNYGRNWAYGAGLYAINRSSIIAQNSTFNSNYIDSAIWSNGAGIYLDHSNAILTNCEVSYNTVRFGAWTHGTGIHSGGWSFPISDSLILRNVKILGNVANKSSSYDGVGLYLSETKCNFENVLIAENLMGSVDSRGGKGIGIYYERRDTSMVSIFDHLTVTNNLKSDSTLTYGTGLFFKGGKLEITNSIFHNSGVGIEIYHPKYIYGNDSVKVSHSNIRGGYSGIGNIDVNSSFVSASDYSLLDSSKCAGAGILIQRVVDDIDGNPRPLPSNTNPDMGCYEINQRATGLFSFSEQNQHILIYPNPVKRGDRVYIKANSINNVVLFDSKGKDFNVDLKGINFETAHFSTSHLKRGIYFLRLNTQVIKKIVVTD